jgi:hypothetical protein
MARTNRQAGAIAACALVAAQIAPAPALLGPVGLAPAEAQQRTQRINCYSNGDRPNTCRLPDNTVSISYMGPDRSGRCIQGQTWQQRGNGLWVTQGCGGVFEVVTRYGGSGGSGGGNWGGSGGSSGGGWGGSGGSQGFAGEITCRSRDGREETCYANTQGRVEMLQQYSSSSCTEGRSWRASRNSITVRAGCQARFGYGYGNSSGGGNWGGGSSNQGFAGQLECRSDNNRYRRCGANTENRVELLRQFSSASCTRGRSWGWDRSGIWVDNGCQGRFGYGYGNVRGDTSDSGGSNTGAVIGGVALAAGLVALLATAGKSSERSATGTAAAVDADLNKFPGDARTAGQACMQEAARQVGQTGGTRVRLDSLDGASRSGDGWSIQARLTGSYPDHSQRMTMDCRTSGDRVTAFDVR